MFAALSLVMIALAPNYIGDAEARTLEKKVVLTEPQPDVDLTITQVFEPQKSTESSVKAVDLSFYIISINSFTNF